MAIFNKRVVPLWTVVLKPANVFSFKATYPLISISSSKKQDLVAASSLQGGSIAADLNTVQL